MPNLSSAWTGLWWTAVAICFAPTGALGQKQASLAAEVGDVDGDRLAHDQFLAGNAAYERGDYSDALSLFEQAYHHSPRPAFLFNIGHVADRLRLDAKALEAFRAYLVRVPDASNRSAVESRIRVLEASMEQKRSAAEHRDAEPTAPQPVQKSPSAAEVAAAAPLATPEQHAADVAPAERARVRRRRWIWASVGAAVVVGVATGVALALRSGPTQTAEPYAGTPPVDPLQAP
jgi:tetratricopeptide (TPR) repeat protein